MTIELRAASHPSVLEPRISVGICTFQRISVSDTLRSISQLDEGLVPVEILIADNDKTEKARRRIETAGHHFKLPVHYIHAPAGNISVARNACLDACQTRWLAFIDDDETARPDWLIRLAEFRSGCHAIIGRSQAIYSPELPDWVAVCDFHSNRIEGNPANGYTSNALIDAEFVKSIGLRFDLGLGVTGGEDTMFFRQLEKAGGRIVYQPKSVVDEPVPPHRATMRWVLRRSFRSGQTHTKVTQQIGYERLGLVACSAILKSLMCFLVSAIGFIRPDLGRKWLQRAFLHAGVVWQALGLVSVSEYRNPATN